MSQPERLGRYTILGLLGSGAMGDVYLAEDPQIERRLAIKTVRLGGRDEDVEERKQRLLREAKAAGKLIHPHVVTLFDYGEDQGVVYLAFEYVEGEDLRQRIDRDPPLTVREALTLVRQSADALAAAHRHSIVHRDIKPANILVTASGDAKVTDFGIAKLRDEASNLTMSGSIIGTPHYMSPEQVKGEALDGRSDLFSLGSVLYEMFHGARPFQADSLTTVVYLILHHDPFERKREDLPAAIEDLLERMLAKDHDRRFIRGEQVVAEIDRILAELPENQLASPAIGPCPPAHAKAPATQLLGETTPLSLTLPAPPGQPTRPPGVPPPMQAPPAGPMALPPPVASSTGTMAPGPAPAYPTGTGTVLPAHVPGTGTVPATQPGFGTMSSPPARSRVWMVVGCIGVPLLVFAGLLVLAVPRAIDWVEARSIATTTGEQEPLEPGTETTPEGAQPTREVAELGAADQEQTPGLAEEEVAADGAESPAAETTPEPDPPTPNQSVSETPREPDRPPTQRPRDERSQQQAGRSSSPSRTTPPASRPTTPAVTEPATEPRAEPEPSRTVPAPADPPVERQVPFDSELDGGLRVSLVVEPEDAFVLLRSSYDERYTVVGKALEFDATKRRGAPLALPSDGTFYVMLRAEGFADHVVKVNASPARGAVATFSLKMGRPGQRAGSAPGQASVIEVRQGITFGDGPRRAKVEVDGEDMGQLRRFQDGGLLPLGPGRHRVVVSLGSQRWELEVNVTSAASSERQVVRIGASD